MRALVYDSYGGPEQLCLAELPTPEPGAGEVLLRVIAVSLNRSDWESLTGSPAYARMGGWRRPRRRVLGSDVAAEVVALGAAVTGFKVGDVVYGDLMQQLGCLAEYVLAEPRQLAKVPRGLSPDVASCLPQAGAIAEQGINQLVESGQHVLINGAGGGTGMLAIQLAKRLGAEVSAVDNAAKLEFMRELGADHVLDFARQDYTRQSQKYDLVLDLVAHRPPWAYQRALAKGGRFLIVGGPVKVLLATAGWSLVARGFGKRLGVLMVRPGVDRLNPLVELVQSGEVKVYIDRAFRLEQAAEALAYVGNGQALGKVVVHPTSGR